MIRPASPASHRRSRFVRRQRGMNLPELMVSILISAILMTGIIQLFVSNKATYELTDDLSRLQENGRFALEAMARDLRSAGFFGCADDLRTVTNHLDGAEVEGRLYSISHAVDGLESVGGGSRWYPSRSRVLTETAGNAAPESIVSGTDAISVRYADGAQRMDVIEPLMSTRGDPLRTAPSDMEQGEIVVVSDCTGADVFQITGPAGTDPGTLGTLEHQLRTSGGLPVPGNTNNASGGNCTGGTTQCLSKVYEKGAKVSRLIARTYYIGQGSSGPSLFRRSLAPTPAAVPENLELVEGVENMQILYGVDTGEDQVPDVYRTASAVGSDWSKVISVRIGLLVRTIDEIRQGGDRDTKTYRVNGNIIGPVNDRRYRRVFSKTVLVRNNR